MSFRLTHPLPEKCIVAVSGGVDSMSVLHFLNRRPGRVARVIHINHASGSFSDKAEALVQEVCEQQKIGLTIRRIEVHIGEGESKENFWRNQRYRFFWDEWAIHNLPIVLAHNMDDCFEEYVICTMVRGYTGTIPYRHGCCVRPFRLWKRRDIESYALRNKIPWLHDPTNDDDCKFLRAKVRRRIAPRLRDLNPGIYNIVEKVIQDQDQRDGNPLQIEDSELTPGTDDALTKGL